MNNAYYSFVPSSIGMIGLLYTTQALLRVWFAQTQQTLPILADFSLNIKKQERQTEFTREMEEYFQRTRTDFTFPIELPFCTAFQREVWTQTQKIPYAHAASYKDIAEAICRPRAYRAVGNALHQNSLPIVIPCHRVILHSGAMGMFGGDIHIKDFLLKFEQGIL